jgi:RNA-directed DNA polymerase
VGWKDEKKDLLMDSSNVKNPNDKSVRKLTDHVKLEGCVKVHSLIDKIFHPKNLNEAWQRVRANGGSGGVDGISVAEFENNAEENLHKLFEQLRDSTYVPKPVRRVHIPKEGTSGELRPLGIPSIFDRVCQQAVVNKIEPIFEEVFDAGSFGYRKGKSQRDALSKIWREVNQGNEWLVDADLKDYFGSVCHDKLLTLAAQRISDGRVLRLLESFLKAGTVEANKFTPTAVGTPQGGVVSPCLSNLLLTPFDKEMRRKGYQLTRWADDWVVTCKSKREAQAALRIATKILSKLGVKLNPKKTRITHVRFGFTFLGFTIRQGKGQFDLSPSRITAKVNARHLYAIPSDKAVQKFRTKIRALTLRKAPHKSKQLVERLNPVIRGWGNYFARSNVRRIFNMLDRWIVRRIWSHRCKRWRNAGWKTLPTKVLVENYELVRLVHLIPSIKAAKAHSQKAVCGKTARTV